jgi:hypothetical protein
MAATATPTRSSRASARRDEYEIRTLPRPHCRGNRRGAAHFRLPERASADFNRSPASWLRKHGLRDRLLDREGINGPTPTLRAAPAAERRSSLGDFAAIVARA